MYRPRRSARTHVLGQPRPVGLRSFFLKVMEFSPTEHVAANREIGDTGRSGVIEEMLATTAPRWSIGER